jgi:putative DNA primase/helicase
MANMERQMFDQNDEGPAKLNKTGSRRLKEFHVGDAVFSIFARYEIYNEDELGIVLSFIDDHGRKKTRLIPRYELLSVNSIKKALSVVGFPVPFDSDEVKELASILQQKAPKKIGVYTRTNGWFEGNFVLMGSSFGPKSRVYKLHPDSLKNYPNLRTNGTHEEWVENVAIPCDGNSRLLFALSFAFTPPMIELIGAEMKVINYMGSGRSGKSTILEVGGSVYGGTGKREGYMEKWRSSSKTNGLEAIAYHYNDLLLCLDELSQLPKEARGDAIHALVEGRGRSRAEQSGKLARNSSVWRTNILSSSNDSPEDYGFISNGRTRAAQESRFLIIPADAGEGYGIFDSVPMEINGSNIKSGERFSSYLQKATRTYYGTPIRAFLKKYTSERSQDKNALAEKINKNIQFFISKAGADSTDAIKLNGAKAFGFVYAAGILASEYEVVPFDQDSILSAVLRCYNDHRDFQCASAFQKESLNKNDAEKIIQAVYDLVVKNREKFIPYNRKGEITDLNEFDRSLGVRTKLSSGDKRFYIKPAVLHESVSGCSPQIILNTLKESEILVLGHDMRTKIQKTFGVSGKRGYYCISHDALTNELLL